jgi:UDP-N-acetylglucosamine 1-carboxyvinyltransferase
MIEKLIVEGGHSLSGNIKAQGAKNSVLPILAATLLGKGESVIHNCPNLKDVRSAIDILNHLGCRVTKEENTIIVDSAGMDRFDIPSHLMREMRSSVMFLGAILGRCGRAEMSFPGGCELGPRPIDLHITALKKLGADIKDRHGFFDCYAPAITGTSIHLSIPSVGATENIMLASAVSQGQTTIVNPAKEPEIEDLQNFLNAMGAKVSGRGAALSASRAWRPCTGPSIP